MICSEQPIQHARQFPDRHTRANWKRGNRYPPLAKLPYGRITAVDLNTGEHRWMRLVGERPRDHAALQHLKLPALGWPRRSLSLTYMAAGKRFLVIPIGGTSQPAELVALGLP
ncbi:MAG TPA: hypothetical protein VNP04_08755 [Alphaproteobacteria bacterium]|nr:hypothetical protein [Alphaproteobacteria bacterium]